MARVQVPVTEITPPKAKLTTALAGANNDLVYTARSGGSGGNSISVTYIVAGMNTPLSVKVEGPKIIVNVATDGGGAATSTATQVRTAVERAASHLVTVALAPGNDGSGIVTAMAATNLSGGSLQTTPPASVAADHVNGHYFRGNDGLTFLEVVSSNPAATTVSISYSPTYAPIASVPDQVETIPAGQTRLLGPFSSAAFDQNADRDVYFTPSVSTTLAFRAYRVVKAT